MDPSRDQGSGGHRSLPFDVIELMNAPQKSRICERCGNESDQFANVEAGMRLAIKASPDQVAEALPSQVCKNCYAELSSQVSRGAKLRIEQQAREKNKQMLWKSRVNLIKQARNKMTQKSYSEAAVSYEKYLRVLEMAYEKKKGGLSPDVFGKTTKSKEITVVTSCYWDLMRIYDSHPNYRQKMAMAADKLKDFLPYSRIYPDISRKAQTFLGSSNNKDIVRKFLSDIRAGKPKCFIATAAFEAPLSPEVQILRAFRDNTLKRSLLGRVFIKAYYNASPALADWIAQSNSRKKTTRRLLRLFIRLLVKIS